MTNAVEPNIVNEPGVDYVLGKSDTGLTYVNPFRDKFFKKIFASEQSKSVLMAFLNSVLEDREIEAIKYGKNEYPGEIDSERNAAFDVVCTDTKGTTFLVEVQRVYQLHFKDRSIFYAGRLISDQGPKGNPDWEYELKEIYVICLLVDFELPGSISDQYLHNVVLNYKKTIVQFYDKLEFIYLEVSKFKKQGGELNTLLDQWLYALKNAEKLDNVPAFLNAPELDQFFYLAKYSKLTKEERNMYRTKEQVGWDNKNTANYAGGRKEGIKEGNEQARIEIALGMKQLGINMESIVKLTKLSREQIEALK